MTVLDIAYANKRRHIVPLEQRVHAMLELLPFNALSLVTVANRNQALALGRRGGARACFALRRKRRSSSSSLASRCRMRRSFYAACVMSARASRCDATAAADFYEAAVRDPVTSRCGGAPNMRAYSRLNCEALS